MCRVCVYCTVQYGRNTMHVTNLPAFRWPHPRSTFDGLLRNVSSGRFHFSFLFAFPHLECLALWRTHDTTIRGQFKPMSWPWTSTFAGPKNSTTTFSLCRMLSCWFLTFSFFSSSKCCMACGFCTWEFRFKREVMFCEMMFVTSPNSVIQGIEWDGEPMMCGNKNKQKKQASTWRSTPTNPCAGNWHKIGKLTLKRLLWESFISTGWVTLAFGKGTKISWY